MDGAATIIMGVTICAFGVVMLRKREFGQKLVYRSVPRTFRTAAARLYGLRDVDQLRKVFAYGYVAFGLAFAAIGIGLLT